MHNRPVPTDQPRLAIIGAGLSGLTLARRLMSCAHYDLFEKSRGLGGRLATRYADDYQFDHGAPGFTATSAAFQDFVHMLEQAGVVAPWQTTDVELQAGKAPVIIECPEHRYVGVPRMNQIGKYLAQDLSVQRQIRITCIQGTSRNWRLQDEQGNLYGPYNWVISTAPPAQTAALLPPGYLPAVQTDPMDGCYVLMLGLAQSLPLSWQIAEATDPMIHRIWLNHTKPGRPAGYSVVVHSTSTWAAAHSEADKEWVQTQMIQSAGQLIGQDLSQPAHRALHLWRYATCVPETLGALHYTDIDAGLTACGDWCGSGTVEAAYHSACAAADTIQHSLRQHSQQGGG
ncbi:MAG: NAD(P)-binding protein [Pseudomonadota bacterium]